jgi:hypothetical protein
MHSHGLMERALYHWLTLTEILNGSTQLQMEIGNQAI